MTQAGTLPGLRFGRVVNAGGLSAPAGICHLPANCEAPAMRPSLAQRRTSCGEQPQVAAAWDAVMNWEMSFMWSPVSIH